MPTYPGSGGSASVGTYYVTASKARGFTYLLKATATVNGATTVVSKLVQLNVTPSVASFAAYSLRKLVPGYMGSAVRVRCAYTGTTTDIGFTASGDFDIAGLRACLGDSDFPLDAISGAKAAYGLRKLRSGYNGDAILVRRSSDNATQGIGFDANGNLDTVSLKSFSGSSSAYIDTWYDQSGSGYNLTQGANAKQPRIVSAGTIDMKNNVPSLYFGGAQSLSNTAVAGAISGAELRSFLVAGYTSSTNVWGHFATLYKTGDSYDYSTSTSAELLAMGGNTSQVFYTTNNNSIEAGSLTAEKLYQFTSYHNAGNNQKLYCNGTQTDSSSKSMNLSTNSIILGTGAADDSAAYISGYISEFILYSSNLSASNQSSIENNQGHYYNIAAFRDGFVTTWYDQSGNGLNLTQGTNNLQPSVDMSGVRPAVYFQGTQGQYMDNTLANQTTALISGFTVAQINDYYNTPASIPTHGRIVSVGKTGDALDWGNTTSTALLHKNNQNFGNARNSDLLLTYSTSSYKDFQASTIFNGTNRTCRQEQGGTTYTNSTTSNATGNLVINRIRIGAPMNNGPAAHEYWSGRINEVLMNVVSVTSNQYQNIEDDQQAYYQLQ